MALINVFIGDPKQTGSVACTSRYTIRRLTRYLQQEDTYLIELGAGNGNVTQGILERMSLEARLLSFEINPVLAKKAKERVKDARVVIINDDAANLEQYLGEHDFERVDQIISTLPLVNLPPEKRNRIIEVSYDSLRQGGLFLQIEYIKPYRINKKVLKERFKSVQVRSSLINLPPTWIYVCQK